MSTRYALGILLAINTLNFYDRQVLSAVAEPLRKEWGLSDTQLGALQTAFTLLYAFVGVPFGRLADTRSRKLILAAGCFAWSLLTALSGLARGFFDLFALRLGVGIGEASCAPAANSLIGDLVPGERRARALSAFMLGLPLGLALSFVVSGAVAQAYGWRAAFYVAGLPGMLVAIAALFVPEPTRAAASPGVAAAGSPYLLLLGIPSFVWIVVTGALHNFNMYALSSFLSPLLMRYHGVSVAEAGLLATLIYGVAGGVGLSLGGALSDRLAARRRDGRLLLIAGSILASSPLVVLALQRPRGDVHGFAALMGLAVLAMYVYYGSIYAALQDVVPAALRGTALALYFLAMYVLGASLGPYLTGVLSDQFAARAAAAAGGSSLEAFRAEGLRGALYAIPALGLLLAAAAVMAARGAPADAARLEGGTGWVR
jgi:MFS family permease